ncbi:MAG: porin [Gemmatimonadota bacterium]
MRRQNRPLPLAAVAGVGLLVFLGNTGSLWAQGLKVSGYGDLEWTLQRQDDPNDKYHNFFDNHHLNLILTGWVVGDVQVGAEVEYEHAGEEIALEYAYLAYTGIKNLRLAAGKFIIPFNRFNKDLHPTWISKIPGRPVVYSNVFPTTYADVGVWASGGLPLGQGNRFTYDLYVVNGLAGEPDEPNFRDLRENDRDKPFKNDNKAVGGRLGVEVAKGLGLGFSGYSAKYAPDLQISFVGGDLDYHLNELELRGEVVHSIQELTTALNETRTGFYAQAAYGLGRLSEKLANLEPVVRFSLADFSADEDDRTELATGFSYYLSPSAIVRFAYFFNGEKDGFEKKNNKLMGQFSVVF